MKYVAAATLAAVSLLGTSHLSAQIIWGTATAITGPTDVSMLGTFLSGATADNSGDTDVVGDATFVHGGTSMITLPNVGGSDGSTSPTPSATSANAANYNDLLLGCAYVGTGTDSATIVLGSASNPLTLGSTYQVQIWDSVDYSGRTTTFSDTTPTDSSIPGGDSVTLDPSIAGPTGDYGIGEYAIGTFVATGTTEDISWTSTAGSLDAQFGEVNAVDLRAVPEPSTYALMFGGLGLLGLVLRRKSSSFVL
jgi:hypothetical protein